MRLDARTDEALVDPPSRATAQAMEDATYVDAALYERLCRASAAMHDRLGPSGDLDNQLTPHIARYLSWEARLLDTGRYREWLKLLTENCIYWIPSTREPGDPRRHCGVNFDDRRRLVDRITLIETGALHAQTPPSRTCRMITNVECWQEQDHLDVRSNLILMEYRAGRMTCYAGSQHHEFVGQPHDWRIRKKVIHLLDCDQPQGNITFIL
jgi:3-phenylpropionate/cinnamic acid dioxygenase small subunit